MLNHLIHEVLETNTRRIRRFKELSARTGIAYPSLMRFATRNDERNIAMTKKVLKIMYLIRIGDMTLDKAIEFLEMQ